MLSAGYNPIAAVVPYGSSVNTATKDLPNTSVTTNAGAPCAYILSFPGGRYFAASFKYLAVGVVGANEAGDS